MPTETWFIYALGGGWGHLNRAIALARLAARDRKIHLLTNSPYADRILSFVSECSITLHLLPEETSVADAREFVQSTLRAVDYDCLVVDTFPRGLLGELAELIPQQPSVCHVLVHRDINPDYIAAKDLHPFVAANYDGILIPGETDPPLAHLPQAKVTAPWLSRHSSELASVSRSDWFVLDAGLAQRPVVVVCAAGQPQEVALFGRITSQLATALPTVTVRCLAASCPTTLAPELWISHWPGMELLQFADVVVGSGGYNLVHECAALKVPLVAIALPRRYDRQARRILQHGHLVERVKDIVSAVRVLIQKKRVCKTPDYENGVEDAIAHIKTWNRGKQRSQ